MHVRGVLPWGLCWRREGRSAGFSLGDTHGSISVCLSFLGGGAGASSRPPAGNVTLCAGVLELGGSTGLLVSPVSVHACTESPSVYPGPPTATCPNGLATGLAQVLAFLGVGVSCQTGWG